MTIGLNLQMRVWRITNPTDDVIGGAVPSGTLIYDCVPARLENTKPSLLLLQQGFEVDKVFQGICEDNIVVYEKDEMEIIFPTNHPYINIRLVVHGIQFTSLHPDDSRGYLLLTLKHKDYAHG